MPRLYTTIYLILLFFFLGTAKEGSAQRFLGAMSLGMNLTQVDGDEFYGFHKVGLNVGPMVTMPFGKNKAWSASMELLYSQKGSRHNSSTDSLDYKINQDYVEIPVIVHYTDKQKVSGGLGFAYGQLVNYRVTENSFYDSIFYYQNDVSNYDLSIIADIRVRIWNKLWADLRYQYSLKSNRTVLVKDRGTYPVQEFTRYQYNNVISIRLTWVFNQEKLTKQPKK